MVVVTCAQKDVSERRKCWMVDSQTQGAMAFCMAGGDIEDGMAVVYLLMFKKALR